MKIYRIKLITYSPTLTPFQADIIFGHLCWVIAYKEGENKLQEFLNPFINDNPPFLISDGFPNELLPKPLSIRWEDTQEFVSREEMEKRKKIKKSELVTLEDFNSIRKGPISELQSFEKNFRNITTPHNTISRLTNTALTEGGVYSLEEAIIPKVSIYLKVISEEENWKNKVSELLEELSKSGYGKKKSIGKGQFKVLEIEEFNKFDKIEEANGFVTLSNFCPKVEDPTEGMYKTFVKYGKLGEEFTFCGNPFKRPLIMIKTGSVFKTNGKPKEFYGRMIKEISPVKKEVVQYAFAFPIPIRYP